MQFIRESQFKANLHSHSTRSDGTLTPAELKELYKGQGYSILAITDHEHPGDHSALSDPDFLLLAGYEAYIRRTPDGSFNGFLPEVHLNLYARDPHNIVQIWPDKRYMKYFRDPAERENHPTYGPSTPRGYDADAVNEYLRLAREDGYLVAYNHPVWSRQSAADIAALEGLFSIEIFNGQSYLCGLPEYNGALYDLLLRAGKRLFIHSADDNHNRTPKGSPSDDSFLGFTMFNLDGDELSYENVIRAMESGSFYASQGPRIYSLSIEDGTAHIRTSAAARISLITDGQRNRTVFPERFGEYLYGADLPLIEGAGFVRFNVTDEFGRAADTRAYFPEEYC